MNLIFRSIFLAYANNAINFENNLWRKCMPAGVDKIVPESHLQANPIRATHCFGWLSKIYEVNLPQRVTYFPRFVRPFRFMNLEAEIVWQHKLLLHDTKVRKDQQNQLIVVDTL